MLTDRRAAILAAAVELIREKGVASVRTRDVTARAGVGIGLLNHYFRWGSLRATAAAEALQTEIDHILPGQGLPEWQLDAFIARAFTCEADLLWRLWIEISDLAMTDADMGEAASGCAEGILDLVATILAKGAAQGLWRCAEPRGSAMRILAFHDGLVGFVLTGLPKLERSEASVHFERFVALELGRDAHDD